MGECMFAVTRGLRLVAGLALFAAIAPASALAQSTFQPVTASTRSDCGVEPHPKAIDPAVIECHAQFARLPDFPQEINPENPDHLEVLREKADILLRQLRRPEACGKGSKVGPAQACAILVYVLDPEYRQEGLPWTYIVKIYRTNHPPAGRLREMVVQVIQSNNSEKRYGLNAADGEVWNLLADQRAKVRCKPGATEFIRESGSPSANRDRNPDKCNDTHMDARYSPVLLIGRGEAEQVLNAKSIRYNFGPQ